MECWEQFHLNYSTLMKSVLNFAVVQIDRWLAALFHVAAHLVQRQQLLNKFQYFIHLTEVVRNTEQTEEKLDLPGMRACVASGFSANKNAF